MPSRVPVPSSRGLAAVGAVALLAGLVVRLVVIQSSLGTLDSDEAVVGIMARHLLHGRPAAFYAGQVYGGTLETALAAGAFGVVGPGTFALKAVPIALDGLAAALTWRIGLRLTGARTAALAGALVWLWPATYLWWSTKERGFYEAGLCLTLVAALLAIRIIGNTGAARWPDWLGLGLATGLGWWQTPQVVYVLAPVGVWMFWTLRTQAWRGVAAIPTFVIGASPWIWPNIHDGFASLHPPPSPIKGGYLDHLFTLAHVGTPMTLGLRVPYATRWLTPAPMAQLLFVIALGGIVAGCARRWPGGRLVAVVLVALPFLHALLPLAGTVAEGRYTLFALPWIALAVAHRADRPVAGSAVFVIALGLTAIGLVSMRGETDPYGPDRHVPRSLAALRDGLDGHGVRRVWANYWVAYRLTFETNEHIVAAPASSSRFPSLDRTVRADPGAGHVFMTGSHTEAVFHAALEQRRIPYERWTAGADWVVYVPHTPVGPTDIDNTYP